jgi:hypothetical protein
MNSLPVDHAARQPAREPFHFSSSANLLQIGKEKAATLGEFLEALRRCPDGSIFQHTFRTLEEHHFIRQGFSNDFAHWAYNDCGEIGLGEKLAAIDVREFTSIADLRGRITATVEQHLQRNKDVAGRPARKAFYFGTSDTVVLPTVEVAHNLPEFVDALRRIAIHSIHHHFIEARLRLRLQSNDFSLWLEAGLGLSGYAARVNQIDIYTSTLEGVRQKIVSILEGALRKPLPAAPVNGATQ